MQMLLCLQLSYVTRTPPSVMLPIRCWVTGNKLEQHAANDAWRKAHKALDGCLQLLYANIEVTLAQMGSVQSATVWVLWPQIRAAHADLGFALLHSDRSIKQPKTGAAKALVRCILLKATVHG